MRLFQIEHNGKPGLMLLPEQFGQMTHVVQRFEVFFESQVRNGAACTNHTKIHLVQRI
jgi:hypothetical protein